MLKSIQTFFFNLFNWKQRSKAKRYEKLLIKGIINKEKEKIKLIREASAMIPKKTKKGVSQYIPMSYTTRAKIKAMILADYGFKMKVLGMSITDDLKFI